MKKQYNLFVVFAFVALLVTSCTVTRPYLVTNNPIGKKKGTSSTTVIFGNGGTASPLLHLSSSGIRFNRTYGIVEAAKRGKITRVALVDLQYTNYLLLENTH